ncbi:phosphoribosyltransferase [Sphingomonas sp. IC4-52]|uniref:phosphoribosyltransferase n=1 Tax=Sphingomonas sp. IC4-52 TaxID=2887202 RepID=UPI001D10BBF4|nr:phosphoribosyltransferase family protein [Sphingomonas sp. IC4-52]MCC2981016.1 phosphoribosyltransferase domain-containing protein [Sphingomonas sp. IC4-52]
MSPVFTSISHDAFVADVQALAAGIAAAPGWRPDTIIGIGRGGLVPAVYLSHAIGLPMLSCDFTSQVQDGAGDLLIRLAERTRGGERLLFVDDINDSGRTIGMLRAHLAAAGAVAEMVRFATLIDNEVSAQPVDYRARTIDRRIVKDWFVFPWEALASAEAIADDAAEVPDRLG